ncbi:MAG: hypothetical protein EBX41_04110 [Chitinophagia bacterium]|nr:hypothetical protein [Chitinophagia bacterium]
MKQQPLHNAYYLNLMNNYCGKWIKHCGWYPEYKLRLLNKHHATMNLNKVHEGFSMNTKGDKPGYLPGHLLHYSYYTIADHVQKIQLYTNWAVEKAAVKKRNISLLKLLVGPRFTFFYHFVLRLGFLDGYWGYVLCKNLAYETFVKYVKIRAFNQQNKAKP